MKNIYRNHMRGCIILWIICPFSSQSFSHVTDLFPYRYGDLWGFTDKNHKVVILYSDTH
jgi:hypothetical protein